MEEIKIDELYNLDVSICEYIIPRLEKFREITFSYPGSYSSLETWKEDLDKMIIAFKYLEVIPDYKEDNKFKEKQEGLELFVKNFENLWL